MNQGKMAVTIVVVLVVTGLLWTYFHCAPLSSCPWSKTLVDKTPNKVTLTFYGAYDTKNNWAGVINAFRAQERIDRNLDVTVVYTQLNKYNYEDLIYDSLVNKKGPNIFMMFNSWLPKYEARITEMPETIMTMDQFEKNFVPVTMDDLTVTNASTGVSKIYSLPLYVDTPALYYNKDMLYNAEIVHTPTTWPEFADDVEKLTILDSNGKIKRSGAAFGGSKYVNRSQDIVMMMVMQNNMKSSDTSGNLVSFRTEESARAVKLYTDYANSANRFYSWDYDSQIYSIDAFIEGKAAMSINYSYDIMTIDEKTRGSLNYGTAPVPQKYADFKANYANYWSPVVAKGADCAKEKGTVVDCEALAWDFVSFAAKPDNARIYLNSTQRPAANLTLVEEQMGEVGSKLAPFAEQTLTAKSWSNANNKKSDAVLLNMIETIITTDKEKKATIYEAMKLAKDNIKELN
ncbi:MAG: extracellular solute-binding protein [Candidatus Pacebacteria bacterium]|nr:extracellular solute-binding protein [Candidatus Paceibacterota bacterium]